MGVVGGELIGMSRYKSFKFWFEMGVFVIVYVVEVMMLMNN